MWCVYGEFKYGETIGECLKVPKVDISQIPEPLRSGIRQISTTVWIQDWKNSADECSFYEYKYDK